MKIGIRELKARAPQVVREVRDTGETVEITYRGAVVARLSPAEETRAGDFASAWKEFQAVARSVGKRARGRKTSRAASGWRRTL